MINPKRRLLLQGSLLGISVTAGTILHADEESSEDYADPKSADDWMKKWVASIPGDGTRTPSGMLFLGRFADPMYFTTQEIGWSPEPDKAGEYREVRVPAGFVTDLASIPRPFWALLRPDGDYGYAAIVHDYLYWEQPILREKADNIFKFLMQNFKVSPSTINVIYSAVRLRGSKAWNDNTKRRQDGEKRILKRYPVDPTMRWSEWKEQTDVF